MQLLLRRNRHHEVSAGYATPKLSQKFFTLLMLALPRRPPVQQSHNWPQRGVILPSSPYEGHLGTKLKPSITWLPANTQILWAVSLLRLHALLVQKANVQLMQQHCCSTLQNNSHQCSKSASQRDKPLPSNAAIYTLTLTPFLSLKLTPRTTHCPHTASYSLASLQNTPPLPRLNF